ncbi:multisubunit sodium/proton antiporter, MrpD subunit [Halorientalis persicus]|jgi:multicomponent Na+:H+ antiporter subunit D|uniref:Multisubunit sodium/proton antiporter, MrpD subunit n=1 Tax=Halorientalis persicus TaxID=1367881 RepID=A0A1H8KF79_9EURY|nr:monovalent cation/H+ antiporter subunit D family protein [Halorientalis persicus]SEN91643.1 multisubunit sodium/proton antiporter, MrpD subunit [Halorientalis persicus]
MTDLPPFLVALPLVASVVVLFAGLVRSETGWPIAAMAGLGQLGLAGYVAYQVFTAGPTSYVVGGYEAFYGIELVIDGLSASVVVLIAAVSLGVLAFARTAGPRGNPFYATYLLLVGGLTGVVITGDVFNMYVFIEISGLTAYALVASGDTGRSAVAALKYLIVGTVGASLYLLGVGYAYIGTGTLNMADLSAALPTVADGLGYQSTLVQTAFAFIAIGLFIKTAVFPLHTWQPEAYAGSPDSVSGFISALVSTTFAYALIRISLTVFTPDFFAAVDAAQTLLIVGAVVSIVAGSALAVSQSEIKRMLAYSSVSQFGLVLAGLAVLNQTALIGATVHLVGHAIMKGGLFLAAGLIATATGAREVHEYEGLSERMPYAAGAFAVLAFAMVGVPPAVGFVGKWYIAVGAVQAQLWPLAAVILLSTLLTLAYFARLVERMYFREPAATGDLAEGEGTADTRPDAVVADGGRPSVGMYVVVVVAAVLAVALGAAVVPFAEYLQPTIDLLLP